MDDHRSSRHAARDIYDSGGSGSGSASASASGSDSSGGRVVRSGSSSDVNGGIMDERVLMLVFRSLNFDPRAVGAAACVSRRLRAVCERVLWRELCISRAPRMVAALTDGLSPAGRVGGGWPALAKLLFFCCGCRPSRLFAALAAPIPGHFAPESRFSKTAGRSFLPRRCLGDLLYVSDPCEHPAAASGAGPAGNRGGEDLGAFRGVFRGFVRSRTRAWLIGRQAELEARVRCPYCGARVWSMTAAGLVPRSAPRRLGSRDGAVEYFVCVNGHLHGCCWLAHLSDDDGGDDNDDDGGDDDDEGRVAW